MFGLGVNAGPSPDFMARMRQNGKPPVKPKTGVPVNSPTGMHPASSIMQTGNAAPNPYEHMGSSSAGSSSAGPSIVQGPTTMPMGISSPNMMPPQQPQAPPMQSMPMGPNMAGPGMMNNKFWNMYNQNRPQMMG